MISLHVDLTNLSKLIADTVAARAKLTDFRKPLYAIKKYQLRRWATNFSQEGKIYGAWAPLAATTQANRIAENHPPSHPILRREGTLLSWVENANKQGKFAADALTWEFHASGAKDGSYAVYHDGGYFSRLYGAAVPSRIIWDVNAEDEDKNEKRMANYIDGVIAQYFR